MLLGTISPSVLRALVVPETVQAAACEPMLSLNKLAPPLGANCWIGCCHAPPRTEEQWGDQLFVILSVVSSHVVGDAKLRGDDIAVPPGTLYIVDPLVKHWLYGHQSSATVLSEPWVGLRWAVSRRGAAREVRRIAGLLGLEWADAADEKRYRYGPAVAGGSGRATKVALGLPQTQGGDAQLSLEI